MKDGILEPLEVVVLVTGGAIAALESPVSLHDLKTHRKEVLEPIL